MYSVESATPYIVSWAGKKIAGETSRDKGNSCTVLFHSYSLTHTSSATVAHFPRSYNGSIKEYRKDAKTVKASDRLGDATGKEVRSRCSNSSGSGKQEMSRCVREEP